MSTNNHRPVDRDAAEQLFGAASNGIRSSHPPLTALLAAAAAPGRPSELAGEQASTAAFRAAQLTPIPRPHRLSAVKSVVMKALTVKAVAALAATTVGGVALAASTGALPNPLAQPAPVTSSGLSAADPSATPSRAERTSGVGSNAVKSPEAVDSSKGPDASAAPESSLLGLCHAYRAITGNVNGNNNGNNNGNKDKEKAKRRKALDNPAFTTLITAAGGKDKVDGFCQTLLTTPTPARSKDQRGQIGDGDRNRPNPPRGEDGRDKNPASRSSPRATANPQR
jgi:hypothetical protein